MYNVNVSQPYLDPLDYVTRPNEFYMLTQRPKVLYNSISQNYVMWMYADNYDLALRDAGVAQACWPNGPFTFQGVFHPDGNETIDLNVFQNQNGTGYLIRTYYSNKTYYLPAPIMQPIWESVKLPDSTPENVLIDFAMNYHRANYHEGYDNIDDIFSQRWRMEDKPWRIQTGNTVETFNLTSGMFQLNNVVTGGLVAEALPADRQIMLATYLDNTTYRNISGQARTPFSPRASPPGMHSSTIPVDVLRRVNPPSSHSTRTLCCTPSGCPTPCLP